MKTIIVIGDGAGDLPQKALGGRTPLESAYLPNINHLAQRGRTGLLDAVFDDLPVESIVAALGILGYNPYEYFPNGRASFEALAGGVHIAPGDLAFRCNLISVDDGESIGDFTAGLIDDDTARTLVVGTETKHPNIDLHPGQSYRNVLVYRHANVPASEFVCAPPHQNRGGKIEERLVAGRTARAQAIANDLNEFLRQSRHQVSARSAELGAHAHMFWLWSPSDAPRLPSFQQMHGISGAVVGGLRFIAGIGLAAQMHAAQVPGATGYIDSNLPGKAQEAIRLLERHDFVLVHVNAADEEAHQRNLAGKMHALELMDELVVGPIARYLKRNHPDDHRFAFLPDHYTCTHDGKHIVHPVPYLINGVGILPDASQSYGEAEVARHSAAPFPAWKLLPLLRSMT